jgi:hypothetical protein
MFDEYSQSEAPKGSPVSRSLIGLSICVCLFVVSVMTGYVMSCGPGTFSRGPSPFSDIPFFVACASIIGGLIYLIRFIAALIEVSNSKD